MQLVVKQRRMQVKTELSILLLKLSLLRILIMIKYTDNIHTVYL